MSKWAKKVGEKWAGGIKKHGLEGAIIKQTNEYVNQVEELVEELLSEASMKEAEEQSNTTSVQIINYIEKGDEEIGMALEISMKEAEENTLVEETRAKLSSEQTIEELATQLVAQTIDVNNIRLTPKKYSLLEIFCMEHFSDTINGGAQILPESLNESLDIIESNLIGET